MAKETSNRIRLGIFVFIGAVIFTTAIYFLGKKKSLFGSYIHLKSVFYNVGGLQVGNNVRFAGINVGTVEDILLINDTAVLVTMLIKGEIQKNIKKDAKAIIGSEGLMGDKLISIGSGMHGKAVSDNDQIQSVRNVDTDVLFRKLAETTQNAARITGDLAVISNHIKEGKGTIGALLVDSSFAKNMKETMKNVKQGASGFKENMQAAQHSFLLKGFFKKKKKQEDDKNQKK